MQPGRSSRHDLERLRWGAGSSQHGERVGLGIESIDLAATGRPMTADAACFGGRAAHAAGGRDLILRTIAAEDLPDLEQRRVGKTAVGVVLRGSNETRDQ